MGGESKTLFAKKCGLSDTLIGKYLRGESYPSINKLPAIANACGKSMSWLLTGADENLSHSEGGSSTPRVSDELTNWWLMIFESLTDTERKKAVSLFQRYGISALLPNIMEEDAAASVISREILQQRSSAENTPPASEVSTQGKKAS